MLQVEMFYNKLPNKTIKATLRLNILNILIRNDRNIEYNRIATLLLFRSSVSAHYNAFSVH